MLCCDQVYENDGVVELTVGRRGDLTAEVRVDFATEDQTATAGEDYEAQVRLTYSVLYSSCSRLFARSGVRV